VTLPSLSAPVVVRNLLAPAAGLLVLLLVAPAFLAIVVALLLRGGLVLTKCRRFYDGRALDIFEFWCAPDSFGDVLWRTRGNQLPILLNVLRGDIALESIRELVEFDDSDVIP
jgi:lipopolysaccharide/colanic/teichoic acid biosynthesis glycosyltransferase